MAKARLINKKTQVIRILDDSYVKIFPDTWDFAPKKGEAPKPETVAVTAQPAAPKKGEAPKPETVAVTAQPAAPKKEGK